MNPSSMQDDFENDVQSSSWLFVNDGVVGSYCQQNVRYFMYISCKLYLSVISVEKLI